MNVLEYLKTTASGSMIESRGVTMASFCIANSFKKHSAIIPTNLLNIVYSGKKILHTQNKDVEVCAGEAFFLAKGEYIMSEIIEGEEYSCLLIFFDEYFMAKMFSEGIFQNQKTTKNKIEPFFKVPLTTHLKNSADSLKLFVNDKPKYADEILELKLKEIITLVAGGVHGEDFIRFLKASIYAKNDLMLFMNDNFTQDLELSEFARLSGRSLSAFKKEFKEIFNETPMKWILQKRVEKAKFLIQNLNYDIAFAAYSAGFKSHSHFCKLHKQLYGKSPKSK